MRKEDYYKVMPKEFIVYLNRYVREYLHANTKEIQKKAEGIYEQFYNKTPKIGGKDNPMAGNLYEFMAFMAYYEATDHEMDERAIKVVAGWLLQDKQKSVRMININKPLGAMIMRLYFNHVARKTEKMKSRGEWMNSWNIIVNPENRKEGCCYTLVGCPLLAFAKANGYEEIMPKFCLIDHDMAKLFNAKLVRFNTEATGGDRCDYWFVGDQSKALEEYADMEIK